MNAGNIRRVGWQAGSSCMKQVIAHPAAENAVGYGGCYRSEHRMGKKMISIICVIAGIFCLGYCILVSAANSGSRFYLIWALGGILLLGMAFLWYFEIWGTIPLVMRRIFRLVVSVGAVLFIIAECCVLSGFNEHGRPGLDYIIVLGAQIKPEGPSIVLKYRLDAACDYLEKNKDTICVLSGGQGRNEPCSEAEGMYRYLVDQGIAPGRLVKEERSTDTAQNIAFSMKLIGQNDASVGIVTNNFHVFRGVRLAKAAGIEDVCGISARSNPLFLLNNMVREFFGVGKDLLCGNLF